jgi:hypothetical protein
MCAAGQPWPRMLSSSSCSTAQPYPARACTARGSLLDVTVQSAEGLADASMQREPDWTALQFNQTGHAMQFNYCCRCRSSIHSGTHTQLASSMQVFAAIQLAGNVPACIPCSGASSVSCAHTALDHHSFVCWCASKLTTPECKCQRQHKYF